MDVKNSTQIRNSILSRLANTAKITGVERNGVLGCLIDAISAELERNYYDVNSLAANLLMPTTYGPYLDIIGSVYGLKRRDKKIVRRIDGIRVYTVDGTPLKNFVNTAYFLNLKITSSTLGGNFKISETIEESRLNFGYIDLTAEVIGYETTHIAENMIDSLTPSKSGIKVTNVYQINLETEAETDSEFLQRIKNHFPATLFGSVESIKQTVLEVPGVHSCVIKENNNIPGIVDVYVLPYDLTSIHAVTDLAGHAAASAVPSGVIVKCHPCEIVYVNLKCEIEAENKKESNAYYISKIKEAIKPIVDNYGFGKKMSKGNLHMLIETIEEISGFSLTQLVFSKSDEYGMGYIVGEDSYQLSEMEYFCLNPEDPIAISWV